MCNLHVILSQYNVFTGICYFILIFLSDTPLTFPECLRSYTKIVTSILRNDYIISLYIAVMQKRHRIVTYLAYY